jgi:hypothetical protein
MNFVVEIVKNSSHNIDPSSNDDDDDDDETSVRKFRFRRPKFLPGSSESSLVQVIVCLHERDFQCWMRQPHPTPHKR